MTLTWTITSDLVLDTLIAELRRAGKRSKKTGGEFTVSWQTMVGEHLYIVIHLAPAKPKERA